MARWFEKRRDREREENKEKVKEKMESLWGIAHNEADEYITDRQTTEVKIGDVWVDVTPYMETGKQIRAMGVSARDASETIEKLSKQFSQSMKGYSIGSNLHFPEVKISGKSTFETFFDTFKKKVTAVHMHEKTYDVDISTALDSFQKYAPGGVRRTWTDQDGEPLHPSLEGALEAELLKDGMIADERVKQLIAEYNDGPVPDATTRPSGHKKHCPYLGTHHFACTCQPRTIFGDVLMWHCDCCGRPGARLQYGLCELCETHEHLTDAQAQVDHDLLL